MNRTTIRAAVAALAAAGLCLTPGLTRAAQPAPVKSSGDTGRVAVSFAGDVHFASQVRGLLRTDKYGHSKLMPVDSIWPESQLVMVNLETALTTSGKPVPKDYNFKAPASALTALQDAGVDVVTMANNHALDYGKAGLDQTLAAKRKSPIGIVGIGADQDQALAPWTTTQNGVSFAVFGAADGEPFDDIAPQAWAAGKHTGGIATWGRHKQALLAGIKKWSHKVDIVIVYMHWGIEKATKPSQTQHALAAAMSDAGADIIVGAHPHVLQGAGWIGKTLVAYSTGNFIWYSQPGRATAVLHVSIEHHKVVSYGWAPAVYDTSGMPHILKPGSAYRSAMSNLDWLHNLSGLHANPGTP